MTAQRLFQTCLVSPYLFSVVRDFLEFIRDHGLEDEEDDSMSDIADDTNDTELEDSDVECDGIENGAARENDSAHATWITTDCNSDGLPTNCTVTAVFVYCRLSFNSACRL